ncbi:MAG: ATP-binding protein [Gammaproteobacteria bacterium]|nr:ATP-binding protein [Gammaproteobacteria bacterium]
MSELKILVVDDDDVDRMAVCRALSASKPDIRIDESNSVAGAIEAMTKTQYDCALLDYMLPDGDGLTMLNSIQEKKLGIPVVILTGQPDERLIVDLLRAGASDYLSKDSLNAEILHHCINTAIRLYRADEESRKTQQELKKSHDDLLEANKHLHETHEQLLQSEKLASIGQLAAGVAHEINNPVGYVFSNLATLQTYVSDICQLLEAYENLESMIESGGDKLEQLLKLKQELDLGYLKRDMQELVSESREGIARVKGIVQDLKDFSHVDEAEWQWANIHRGLDSTLNIVNNEIKYKAEVIKEYGELPDIECLASQVNQVFMNLLVNAAHAIEERGVITVRTGKQDEQIWIEISDTGKGIEPENMKKIFDPFFTTKEVGKGTGLGLSLSYGIINKHHGNIDVQSEAGKGTTFKVWLPVSQSSEEAKEA